MKKVEQKQVDSKKHKSNAKYDGQTAITAFTINSSLVTRRTKARNSIVGLNNTNMDMAAADLCSADNLPFSCFESPQMKHFICLLLFGTVSVDWKPPHRNMISGKLLDINY